MIPRKALEEYARFAGDPDGAAYAKVDAAYWGEIDSLLMHLQIVDSGYAADSFRAHFINQVEKAGVSLDALRGLKTLVDNADAEKKKRAQPSDSVNE